MSISLRKHLAKFLVAAMSVSAMATASAAALDQPVAVLSSKFSSSVGTVLTSDQIKTAQQSLEDAKTQHNANTNSQPVVQPAKPADKIPSVIDPEGHPENKPESKPNTKPENKPESKPNTKPENKPAVNPSDDKAAYDKLLTDPVATKTVAYSSSLVASDAIKKNATDLGGFKLTFYCPCEICNGHSTGETASGTIAAEGRSIAVDPSIIPLGSRVYIEGFGVFIAEDTGGAIKNNKIDVFVSSHSRAYELGVKNANVYLLG